MPNVLICSSVPLSGEWESTLLGREDVHCLQAGSADDATNQARACRPRLVVVDRDLPDAAALIRHLRADGVTRHTSIVVIAPEAAGPGEERLLAAGANAIVRLPGGSEWDELLGRLIAVPPRRQARLPVKIELSGDAISAVQGTIQNLSRMGMLVHVDDALQLGSLVSFSFSLGQGPPVRGRGRVVRDAGPRAWGIEFDELEALGRARLAMWVSAQAVSAG